MTFAMVSLSKHPKSGNWTARKAIPADVRGAYGRCEEKKTWPASLSRGQAKAELAAWLVPIEERITALRASAAQAPLSLSKRQSRALAGEWYSGVVAQHEDDPGGELDWMFAADGTEPIIGPDGKRGKPFLVQQRDDFLAGNGLRLETASADALLSEMEDPWPQLCALMERRARGDYGPDPLVETLPTLEAAPSKPKVAVSINALFDEYEATGTAAPATIKKWRSVIRQFVDFLGHDDASLVTTATMYEWVKVLLAKPLTVKSVRDGYSLLCLREAEVLRIQQLGATIRQPFHAFQMVCGCSSDQRQT